jgi:hypothetical protein
MNSNLENIYHGDEWGWHIDIENTIPNSSPLKICKIKTKMDNKENEMDKEIYNEIDKEIEFEKNLDLNQVTYSKTYKKENKSVFKIFTETIICVLITYIVYRLK